MSNKLSERMTITDPKRRNTYYIEVRGEWRYIERRSEAKTHRNRGKNFYDYSK